MSPEMTHRPCVSCTCGGSLVCPAELEHDMSRINEMLTEAGFEYPVGLRGVKDALSKLRHTQEKVKDLLLMNDRAAERIQQLEAELETLREQQK
jgi:hypothetical protein